MSNSHFPIRLGCPECKVQSDHAWWCGVGAKENDARPAGKKHYYWRD